MENEEMLELTNDTENTDTQSAEEMAGGIELTDTEGEQSSKEKEPEKEEVRQTLRELLKNNPDYQQEFSDMMKTRLDRQERNFQKELSKYKDTENVLKSTLNASDIEEANKKLREYYENEGIKLPEVYKPELSSREIEVLAKADAQDFINEGYDSMLSEANRLAAKEYKNLNDRERIVFNTLAQELNNEKTRRELLELGAKEDILKDDSFIKFKSQFNSKTPIKDIYSLYSKTQPKPKVENPGSMKNQPTPNDVKDYYTPEEASKFTRKDYDKNPKLLEAVERSMTKWI